MNRSGEAHSCQTSTPGADECWQELPPTDVHVDYWQNSTGGGAMPAAVLVVHDEPNTRELAVTALRSAFRDVIGFDDPMAALDAIEDDTRIRVLVTRVTFGPGILNGVALARMVRVKRPGTKVVFVARAENESHTEGLGVFIPQPLNADLLVATVGLLLAMQD